ncbi:MAG: efflux RND transporter permease subunit [Candidatus Zixiibacteriota bacterium]
MRLTDISLKSKVAVTVLTVAAIALGFFALPRLSVDYLPEITYPMVKIHIWWRGATPEEIETNIAEPLERAMATVDNLDYLDGSCTEGMYNLLVNFRYGVDVDVAYQDVMAIMGRVSRKLPDDIDPPVVIKADPSQLPVMEVTLFSDQRSLVWLRDWADNWLVDRLNSVPGTAGTEVVGGLEREIRVHLDPERLNAYGISPEQVSAALFEENIQIFAGRVTVESREIIARTMGEFENLDEIRNTVIAHGKNGDMVYVGDVAEVEDSHEEMRVNTRFNGKPCVKINVLKQSESNTVEVAEAVHEKLLALQTDIPDDIEFGIVENQGNYILGAIKSVRDSAILSAILVILVVYLFLGHWRQVVVMLVALPVTLLANFFIMYVAGFSLNLFSLGGMVVALGVILDNSIVVLENITRLKHKAEDIEHHAASNVVSRATSEVGSAIIAATLTFLGIFLPFLIVPGLATLLFKELILVIASIVVLSLLVAVTLTPFLTRLLVMTSKSHGSSCGVAAKFDFIVDRIKIKYSNLLRKLPKKRWAIILGFTLFFIGGLFLARLTGSEFLPKPDDGRVMVKLKMPAGTAVGETDRILANVEKQLEDLPEIKSMFTLAGGRVLGLATFEAAQEGEVDIQLVPKSKRDISTNDFIQKIKPMVKKAMVPGARMPVMQMKTKGIRMMGAQDVEIKIQGSEIEPIYSFAKRVASKLRETPGLSGVNISMDMTKPEYRIYIDRARASALDISVGKVAKRLRGLIGGLVSTEYREGGEFYDIRVIVPEKQLKSKADIESLVLESRDGRAIRVRDIAEVRRAVGPVEIIREDQIKQVIVQADGDNISVGEAIERAENAATSLKAPKGVSFVMGGQAQMMAENQRSMALILVFAVLFAYVVLAIQFDSFILPLLAMINIPFALTGAFAALFIFNVPIGITVLIGLVVMMGGIASQGVVLLTLAEEYRYQGETPLNAVNKAAPIRLRPILMTQLTTILGLMPLALNLGEGGDMLKPMAVAVIGGLLYSLVLTLFFLPSAYSLIMKNKKKV